MKTKKLQSFFMLVAIFFGSMASYLAQPSNTIAVANPNVNALTVKPESVAKMMRLELIKINKYKVYDEFDMNEVIKAKEEYRVDKVLTDRLAFKNELITSNNIGKVNNSGPRIGFAAMTGDVAEFATRSENNGGLGIQPFTSMIGYQIEGQYVGTENFSALVEGIFNISGLEQSQFIPSFSLLNGFRFGKANWEFAFGPRFGVKSTSEGFFDSQNIYSNDGRYFSQTDWNQYLIQNNLNVNQQPGNGYVFETNFDKRGDKKLATSFLIAFGRTFQAGALNIPVNLFYSSQKGGGFVGVNMGFNVQKSKQPINKQSPQRYY